MTKKKVIGIYADSVKGETKQSQAYLNFILNFGVPRLITVYDDPERLVEECDALLVPGGPDVDPRRYGEAPGPSTGRANIHYEYLDQYVLPKFIDAGKPVIGICRGMQSINVHFGGTLFQHMIGHNQMLDITNERSDLTEKLLVPRHRRTYEINSIHHQAVKKLGKGLRPIGFTSAFLKCPSLQHKDLLYVRDFNQFNSQKKKELLSFVEVYEHETLPIIGFQYHPEEIQCEFAINEIKSLLADG